MKFTQYFHAMRGRPDRMAIKLERIEQVIDHPVREVIQSDGRIRRWASIPEAWRPDAPSCPAIGWGNRPKRLFRSGVHTMKIKYFPDTDTLYIEFRPATVSETRDLDEQSKLCALTVEHARERADIPHFSFEQVVA